MGKKVISFSLFGNDPKFLIGAKENVKLAKAIYPGWVCRFYYDRSVPQGVIENLKAGGAEVIDMSDYGIKNGMLWRFLVNDDTDVDIWIIRDTDSRLNPREKEAVDEWIASDKKVHIMRDHPFHAPYNMLAGMCGAKGQITPDMCHAIVSFGSDNRYGADADFLAAHIFPLIKKNALIHDEFYSIYTFCLQAMPFPTKRKDFEYVGEIVDEHGRRNEVYRSMLIHYYSRLKNRSPIRIKFGIRKVMARNYYSEVLLFVILRLLFKLGFLKAKNDYIRAKFM